MAITIGLPPSGMLSHIDDWKRHRDTALRLDVVPYIIEEEKFDDLVKDFINASNTFQCDKKTLVTFASRAESLGAQWDTVTGQIDDSGIIHIYALHEGPITENFSNDISASSLTGMIYEHLGASKLSSLVRAISTSVGTQGIKDSLMSLGNWAFNNGEQSDDVKNIVDALGGDKEKIKGLLSGLEIDGALGENVANAIANMTNVALGQRPLFPQLWNDSSTSTNYTFRVRLYNPNPANWEMHNRYIVSPLAILKALTLPSTIFAEEKTQETTDESGNKSVTGTGEYDYGSTDLTYMAPFYVSVSCKNLFKIEMGMIENLSVILGGDENSVSFNGRPNYVDVTFTVKPIYAKKVIQPSTYRFFANESLNMGELKGEDLSAVDSETNPEDTDEVIVASNTSDEPEGRVDERNKEMSELTEGNGLI